MAFKTYHNPDNFTIGSQFFGVTSITVGTQYGEIHAAADDDTHESVATTATGRTSGSITFVDPGEAQRAQNLAGTISFLWTDADKTSPTNLTVTITGAQTTGWNASVSRDSAANATVGFIAAAAPTIA